MRRFLTLILSAFILISLAGGCQRIPLYERITKVDLRLNLKMEIDTDIEMSVATDLEAQYGHIIHGKMPEYVEALFYDVNTYQLVMATILPAEGGIVEVPAGRDYDIVVYSFGTESTQVGHLGHRLDAEAYTSDITKQMASKLLGAAVDGGSGTKAEPKGYEDDPIIHEPDHLYVANKPGIEIPAFTGKEESVTIHAEASTILDVYSMEVLGIKGAENIEKVDAFITGQIRSNYFGQQLRNVNPATLYVNMQPDTENQRLYTVFGTFGKLAGATNNVYLDITVTDSDGGQYRYIYDVTDQFDDPDNHHNKLIIDGSNIDIPKASQGGGGLDPSVEDWKEEIYDIPLG